MGARGRNEGETYEMIELREFAGLKRKEGMRCLKCGQATYNPTDILNRYCPNCQIFHDDADAEAQWARRNLDGDSQ